MSFAAPRPLQCFTARETCARGGVPSTWLMLRRTGAEISSVAARRFLFWRYLSSCRSPARRRPPATTRVPAIQSWMQRRSFRKMNRMSATLKRPPIAPN